MKRINNFFDLAELVIKVVGLFFIFKIIFD